LFPLQAFNLLPQPGYDAALGDVNCADGKAHLGGYLCRRAALHGSLEECAPRSGLEFAFDALGRLSYQAALIVGFPFAGRALADVGTLPRALLHPRATRSLNAPAAAFQEVEDFVARDGEQPAAKGATRRIVVEPMHGGRNRPEHLLHEIGGIRILEPTFSRE